MEMDSFNQEVVLKKVRNKLREQNVKLWLPPYTTDALKKGEIPLDLIKQYSRDLMLKEETVENALENLRLHAVGKLTEQNKFQTTGIATIKVKVPAGEGSGKRVISLEVSLDKSGDDLKQAVSLESGLEKMRLKLIAAGRVIHDADTLISQNIKNGSQVMAVVLSGTEAEVRQEEQEIADVTRTRQVAELLSTRVENDDDDDMDVQIADQGGRSLNLPKEERKSLTLAMTLHEKGRAALKAKRYSKALLLLLEADKEFSNCRAEILDSVDNFAILCLDIVWCYLCLENVNELPDADARLRKCEATFIRSYGANNERLKMLKNGAEVERILLMRLHLLQGIVGFHQHKMDAAQRLMRQAMDEYNLLQVSPDALAHLIELGFSPREARLGMRACEGNIAAAAGFIMKQRQDRAEVAKKEKEEREERKLAKKYGNCANGDRLNMKNVHMMAEMNFPRAAAAEALKQTNNDVSLALDVLQKQPHLLHVRDVASNRVPVVLRDSDITQLVSLGFEPEAAKTALRRHHNNLQKAVDDLIKYNGQLPYSSDESESSSESESPDRSAAARKREEENREIDELMSDITRDETDHLDLEMTEEKQFLDDYLTKLSSLYE